MYLLNKILSMKKITMLIAFFAFISWQGIAQTSSYSFTASSGTFDTLVAGTNVPAIEADYAISGLLPIGFSFTFDGVSYDSLKAASDGFISFNPSAGASGTNDLDNTTASRRPLIAPLWDDNDGNATGGVSYASYLTTGTAPNRIFTFEWKNWEWRWSSSTPTISFQVKLYETTNEVKMVYRQEAGTVSSGSASIGLTGVSTFLSLDGSGSNPSVSSTSETTSISAKPATGQVYSFTPPSCPAPSALMATSITTTGASFGWTEAGSATMWELEWDTAGFTLGTGNNVAAGTTTNPYAVSTLTANTAYEFYVRSACGLNDSSQWVGPYVFTTACNSVTTFSENFDGVSTPAMPSCWNNLYFSTSTSAYVRTYNSSSNANSGSNSIRFYNSNDLNPVWMLVSPALSNLSAGTHQTAFFAKDSDANDIIIGTMSDPNDTATFTAFDTITTTSSYLEYVVSFASYSGSDSYIAYRSVPGATYDYTYMDDISWMAIPSCPKPSMLTVANVTDSSAYLGWTENGTSTTWDIEWDTAGFTPSGTPTVTGSTTNPHFLTGLSGNTSYEFYIRSSCSATDSSIWVGPLSFTTLCAPVSAPWTENFGTSGSAIPTCWMQGASNSEDWKFSTSGGHVGNGGSIGGTTPSGGRFAYVDDSTPDNTGTALETPLVNMSSITNPELSFYLISNNEGNTNVTFSIDLWDGASWNVGIYSRDSNTVNGEWENIIIDLSSYTFTGAIQIRFVIDELANGDFYDDVAIDDVELRSTPSCNAVSALTVANIATTSANLGWTENGTATLWEIEYDTVGFTPGTGSSDTTTSNPSTLTGLTANTAYEFYVRAVCSAGDSAAWVGPLSFSTPCNAFSIPFVEGFESGYTDQSAVAGCLMQESVTGTQTWTANSSATSYNRTARTGSFNAYLRYSNEDWIFIPINLVSGTSYTADVYARQDGSVTTNADVMIAFGMTGTAAGMTDTIVSPVGIDGTYQLISGAFTPTSTGVFYVGIKGYMNGSPWYISIDDIAINVSPACLAPSALTATTTATGASLGWTENGSATTWDIEWDTAGFTPTGTPTIVGSITNPHALSGLTASTSYEFYVRADCGGTNSTWVGPYSFTTLCNTMTTFPFTESFDVTSPTVQCWANDHVVGAGDWTLSNGAGGGSITAAYSGTENAAFVSASGTNSPTTRLVSPVFDLTSLTLPMMSFYYAQEDWAGDQNYTRVLYRTSTSGAWTQIWADSSDIDTWTQVTLTLPNPSATYQIAFEGINNYGRRNVIDEMEIKETPIPVTTTTATTNVSCNGMLDGTATVTVVTGTSPYSYLWSNGDTTTLADSLAAGTYYVTVTDVVGEVGNDTVVITEPAMLVATVVADSNVSCFGMSDGGASVSAVGGTTPFTFVWSNAATTASVTGLMAGTYYVTVSDANNCSTNDSVMISEPVAVTVSLGNDTTVCDPVALTLDAGNFASYVWDDASMMQTRMTVSTVGAVDYSVVVTDANGCTGNDTIQVTGLAPVMVDLGADTSLCYGVDLTLDAGTFSSYLWNDASTMQTLMVSGSKLGATTYSVGVVDMNGCLGSDNIVVIGYPEVIVNLGADTNIWDPSVTVYTLDAGTGFSTYAWSDGTTTTQTFDVTPGADSNVSVTVTDANGCTGSDTVIVDFVLGINAFEASTLKMYPNPAVDQVTVELSNFKNVSEVNVTFITITGQTVLSQKISVNGNTYVGTFDVSALATGTYFVQFEANGEKVVRQFVIK